MKEIVLVEKLPLSPEEYTHLFFFDPFFVKRFNELRANREVEVTPWNPAPEGRKQRVVNYFAPISNNPVISKLAGGLETKVREVQLLHVTTEGNVIVNVTTGFPQSKLGENLDFRVDWLISEDNEPSQTYSCKSSITIKTDYKGMLFKGTIENFAAEMAQTSFTQWHALCKERVKEYIRDRTPSSPVSSSSENSEDEILESLEADKKEPAIVLNRSDLVIGTESADDDGGDEEFYDANGGSISPCLTPLDGRDQVDDWSLIAENTRQNKLLSNQKSNDSLSLSTTTLSNRPQRRISFVEDYQKELHLIRTELTQLKTMVHSLTPTVETVVSSVVEKSLQTHYHSRNNDVTSLSLSSSRDLQYSSPSTSPIQTDSSSSAVPPTTLYSELHAEKYGLKRTKATSSTPSPSSSSRRNLLTDRVGSRRNLQLLMNSKTLFVIFVTIWPFITYPVVGRVLQWYGNFGSATSDNNSSFLSFLFNIPSLLLQSFSKSSK